MRAIRLATALSVALAMSASAQANVVKYVRYQAGNTTSYGIIEGETIRELRGDLLASPTPTGKTVRLRDVKLLAPIVPSKVIAAGLNYKSHIGNQAPAAYPGFFAKYPSSIIAHEENIIYPADATNLHYEGELVVVIGKRVKDIQPADVPKYIFGVTIGNDVSERNWQRSDLQWFRAKASDTFAPLGPWIVTGVNYNDLLLETRLNGETVQSQRTKDLIFDIPTLISYLSKYMTLEPGDVVYTGTPDNTKPMKPGDVVEVEIEGIGILRNKVAAAPKK